MKKLFTLFVSLWMAIASLFAANISANTVIYFDASAYTNIQTSIASGKTLQMLLGHSTWSQGYKMTAVDGYDNIYSVKMPKWDGCTQLAFCTVDAEWGGEGSSVTSRLNWTYEKTAVHSISSNMSGNVGFAGNPLARTNNYTLPVKAPKITVAAAPEFATTTVGETSNATLKYTLENATEATATIEGEGFSISAQEVGSVTIAFAPEAEGDYTGTLTITSGEVKETVAISATAVAPEAPKVPEILHVSAAEFAEIIEGETTSATVTYELLNAEEATATVEGEGFAITAQEVGSVTIEFTAATAGDYTGKLIITSGETVKEVALAATVIAPTPIVTIKVSVPSNWATCYIWAWTATGNLFTEGWPGKAMTKGEDGFYAIDIETAESISLLVSDNGQDSKKTADYTVGVTESTCFVVENNKLVVNEKCEFEVAPEPDPIEPYVAVRGTMTNWVMANDIKMSFNETANEWFIQGLEIAEGDEFKVVSVDDKGATCDNCWYGATVVEINEELGDYIGLDNIVLSAGKYDIYFKVASQTMWIAPVKEGGDEPGEGGEEPGEPVEPEPGEPVEPEPGEPVEPEPGEPVEPETPAANAITIKVAAPWDNCNLYVWYQEDEAKLAPWPGLVMTKGEDGFFTLDIEITGSVNLIANNGSAQTGDYKVGVTESTCFNIENNKLVINETCTYVEPTLPESYYGIRGLDGTWNFANDVKLTPNEEGSEWSIKGLEVDGTQEFKVVYVDEAGATCDNCWYGATAVEINEELGEIGTDNITLAAGKYDIYFKVVSKTMWIAPVKEGGDEPGEGGEEPDEPVEPEPGEPVEPEPGEPVEPEPGEFPKTITIKVAAAWDNCNLYVWSQEGEIIVSEAWPGSEMVKDEDGFFTLDIEIPASVNLIANNGNAQSGDYKAGVTESTCFNIENNTLVINETCTYVEPTLPESYYGIRGLDGTWNFANDVKLTPNEEGSEWFIKGLEVDGTQEFKVVYVDETGATCDECWYGIAALEFNENISNTGKDNILLAAGAYDIYFKVLTKTMWIQPSAQGPSTDAEEAIAELIYAVDGTIYAPAPFVIIDLAGKDVTNANGALEGAYIVKTQNSITKVLVK